MSSKMSKPSPQKSHHYCSICGDGVYDDEEYVKNTDGEYVHYECDKASGNY